MRDLEVILGVSLNLEFKVCRYPTRVQTIMSQESNPVLSSATPSFEMLFNNKDIPQMKVLVAPSLKKSYKYYKHMDHTKVYVIKMCT